MSLRWYKTPRLVVLEPSTPVLDAARALENNNIGAVVVQDQGQVVGIVTDRDLAVRVLGYALDPRTTPLVKVMTTPVVTLAPTDRQSDALRLMRQRNIRRIPLVEAGRLVGIVTLDDLILDEVAPLEEVAAIIQAQIGEGGPAASVRSPAAQRRAARARATYGRLLNRLRAAANLETAEQAETALEVVLEALVRRLTPDEAEDLIAQLPSLLQPTLRALPPGPDKGITRQAIETALCERLEVDPPRAAQLLDVVGATLAQVVSPGQIEDMRAQLPEEMRSILPEPLPVGS
ncbi:MAG TPA: CBS domain-containing protein [Gemmataceae bacterium]